MVEVRVRVLIGLVLCATCLAIPPSRQSDHKNVGPAGGRGRRGTEHSDRSDNSPALMKVIVSYHDRLLALRVA